MCHLTNASKMTAILYPDSRPYPSSVDPVLDATVLMGMAGRITKRRP